MDDAFRQSVRVHEILGDQAEGGVEVVPTHYQRKLLRRLVDRGHQVSQSLIDQATPAPEVTDALDESLDEQLLNPARRSIVRRTVALERWLADHGFRANRPIRFVRSHRPLSYHRQSLNLSTARPVDRQTFEPADSWLTDRVLDGIQPKSSGLGGVHRRPATNQSGRVSVIPGFILLELPLAEFQRQFGLPVRQAGVDDQSSLYGHVAISQLGAGPVLATTRDHAGEMLTHALEREYTHELAALGEYRHGHSLSSPNRLIQQPGQFHDLPDRFADPSQLDQLAHELLAERVRHLAHECRSANLLTLSDLGFAADDWVPLAHPYPLDDRFVAVAATYLATLLLGRTLVAALNHHPEARTLAPYFPRQAFSDVECRDDWHPHYEAAHHYVNFVRAAQAGQLGGHALDTLYERIVDPVMDFCPTPTTNQSARLHVYPGPIHPIR